MSRDNHPGDSLRGLPGPDDEQDADRMQRKARDAERRIRQQHDESEPADEPIHEE